MNKQEIDKAIEILKYYSPVGAINAGFIEEPNEDAKAYHLAILALEKQVPEKPLEQRYVNYEIENELIGHCPSCRLKWDVAFWQRHCSNCGQRLDWEEEE